MSQSAQTPASEKLAAPAFALSALCLAGVVAAVCVLGSQAQGLLARLDASVGEVLMNEGIRLEEGGFPEDAIQAYQAALRARFQGPHHRIHMLERLGALQREQPDLEAALIALEEAAASEHATLAVFEPLFATLVQLDRDEEAQALFTRWAAAAESEANTAQRAEAAYRMALLRERAGDTEEALAHHAESNRLLPGGPSARALALRQFETGEYKAARKNIETFLVYAPASETEDAMALRERINTKLKGP